MSTPITVSTTIKAPLQEVWERFTHPDHVTQWNTPSPDWHTPRAENDLQTGGSFLYRMEAKDGSEGFDFAGVYDEVTPEKSFAYTMSDGRKVSVVFTENPDDTVTVTETFDPESENTPEFQRSGWQAILDNFTSYAEAA